MAIDGNEGVLPSTSSSWEAPSFGLPEGESNYYVILGISEFSEPKVIKKAYRSLALRCHPDRVPVKDQKRAAEAFVSISAAYNVLSDERKRKRYDSRLARRKSLGFGNGSASFTASSTTSRGVDESQLPSMRQRSRSSSVGNSQQAWYARYRRGSFGKVDYEKERVREKQAWQKLYGHYSCGGNEDVLPPRSAPSSTAGNMRATREVTCPCCGFEFSVRRRRTTKGLKTMECPSCNGIFHDIWCGGCTEWGTSRGVRGQASLKCSCGMSFCQSTCPSCDHWSAWGGQLLGDATRCCPKCKVLYHESYCPACTQWSCFEGSRGADDCETCAKCGQSFFEFQCEGCHEWGGVEGSKGDGVGAITLQCSACGATGHQAKCPSCERWAQYPDNKGGVVQNCQFCRAAFEERSCGDCGSTTWIKPDVSPWRCPCQPEPVKPWKPAEMDPGTLENLSAALAAALMSGAAPKPPPFHKGLSRPHHPERRVSAISFDNPP